MVYKTIVFTGLVQGMGTVVSITEQPQARVLRVRGPVAERDAAIGASICISGVCLTVVAVEPVQGSELEEVSVTFEAAFETLRKTTLGGLDVGSHVNLEPSLRVGDPLGGHIVSGHVDGLAKLRSVEPQGEAKEMWFDLDDSWLALVAPKGSVALDGVSLTVNEVDDSGFMVGVIPHTLAVTTLGALAVGDPVNFEADMLARYTARLLAWNERSNKTDDR